MRRDVVSLVCGSLFGAGLFFSGMTDTTKVQGWLDIFGDWDPTLAFVLGGAILPMVLAWRIAARKKCALLGTAFPGPASRRIDPPLIIGSLLFGIGWALAGLCPGPALASIGYGGTGGAAFLLAMAAGMLVSPVLRTRLTAPLP